MQMQIIEYLIQTKFKVSQKSNRPETAIKVIQTHKPPVLQTREVFSGGRMW